MLSFENVEKVLPTNDTMINSLDNIRVELFKNDQNNSEEEKFRKMMMRKFSEYDKL